MNSKGFTIVELMVAISVTTIMMVVTSVYLMRGLQNSTLQTARGNIQREIQFTLDAVASDVRLSANADLNNRNPDANGPGGPTNQYGWSSSASTLVLATAATTSADAIIFSDPANYVTTKDNIVYFVSNGTLYKRILAANVSNNGAKTTCPQAKVTASCPGDKRLLDNITNFSVTYLDGSNNAVSPTEARSVELSMTATKTLYRQPQTASYTTRMVFRND
jgi:prepilin-type N-terminal cleavage/methylation domain-containing protein